MRELNSAQQGIATGSILRLPRPVDFQPGRGCSRIRAEGTLYCKNNTAGALDLTGAKVKAAAAAAFALSTLQFGTKKLDLVDSGLLFARARELFIAMSNGGDDFVFSAAGYGPKLMQNVADADVVAAAVAAGATVPVTFEFVRSFELDALGQDAYKWCPGAQQMRQLQWEVKSAAWGDATFVFGQAMDCTFIADDFEAHDEKWVAVPRLYQQEEAGRVSHGPGGDFGLIAMWEYTAAGAGTALSIFSLSRDHDSPLQENVRAARVVRDNLYAKAIGSFDLNQLTTLLFAIPSGAEPADIPSGSGFKLEQTSNELNPPKTAWLYVPGWSPVEWDDYAGRNIEHDEETIAISAATKASRPAPGPVAALEGVILTPHDSSDAAVLPGRAYKTGQAPTERIPAPVQAAVKQVAGTGAGVVSKAAGAVAKALPGGNRAKRFTMGSVRSALAQRFR